MLLSVRISKVAFIVANFIKVMLLLYNDHIRHINTLLFSILFLVE